MYVHCCGEGDGHDTTPFSWSVTIIFGCRVKLTPKELMLITMSLFLLQMVGLAHAGSLSSKYSWKHKSPDPLEDHSLQRHSPLPWLFLVVHTLKCRCQAPAVGFVCKTNLSWFQGNLGAMSVNLVDFDDPCPGFLGVTSGMSTTVWRARHKARWLAVGTTAGKSENVFLYWQLGCSRSWPIPKMFCIGATL